MASRVVPERLRVVQRSFLVRRGGRSSFLRAAVSVEYAKPFIDKYRNNYDACPRVINAEAMHGDEQLFWSARRDFYRGRGARNFFPTWDRLAQTVLLLTREVPRVPQEAAFRLFALFMKMLLLPQLMARAEQLLPSWLLLNAEATVKGALPEPAAGAPPTSDSAVGSNTSQQPK